MFECPKIIFPLLSLQVNVKLFSSSNIDFHLMNLLMNTSSKLIVILNSGNCFKSDTEGITDKSINI